MPIKLKKSWLTISFSIVLFSLMSISVARAVSGNFVVTVYDSNCDPVSPYADVIVKQDGEEICNGVTNSFGVFTCPISDPPHDCGPGVQDYFDVIVKVSEVEKYNGVEYTDENCDGSLMVRDVYKCWDEFCVDGYCCDSACDGNCDRCNVSGSEGTCTDVDADCTGNCDYCNNGNCDRDPSLCTGNCDYCNSTMHCAANETVCELKNCADCRRTTVTHYDCQYDPNEDEDCPDCQECGGLDLCVNVSEGGDPKNNCWPNACRYGYCDGFGECKYYSTGTDCGTCASCDGLGYCIYNDTQDDECPFCEECSSKDNCDFAPYGTDPKDECTANENNSYANCGTCSGIDNSCARDPSLCVGNCDYCNSTMHCAANETVCELKYCADCRGSGTSFNCAYDDSEDEDCDPYDVATCFNDPDNYVFTWDFRDSYCTGLDACYQGTITHTCNQSTCFAECDEHADCGDYCSGDIRYYSGSCALSSTCTCSYSTEDCNQYDEWVDTGNFQWVSSGQCTEKEQKEQEYHDYTCSEEPTVECDYSVTDTRWVDTGETRNKPYGTPCNDGNPDTINDQCKYGVCKGEYASCTCTRWFKTWELCWKSSRWGCAYKYVRACTPDRCARETKCVRSWWCRL